MKLLMNNKRYLTGVDWLMHVFDHMNQKMIGRGNEFHFILEVEGLLDCKIFEQELNQFVEQYSIFKGHVSRALNLAPYWKINRSKKNKSIVVSAVNLQDQSDLISRCTQIFEKHCQMDTGYLQCDIIICNEKSYVAFTFSHKIFDGSGAEFFIEAFGDYIEDKQGYVFHDEYIESSHLDDWKDKFKAGKDVNRRLIELSPKGNVRAFSMGGTKSNFRFKVIHFDEGQTQKILERANNEMGYLLIMPFLLSQAVVAVNQLFDKKGIQKDGMVVPVTVNARKNDKSREMFFNHLSFIFFRFSAEAANNPAATIKNQLYDQMKVKFTDQFEKNAMLMRIAPVSILSKLLGLYSKGKIASFSFSYLGETGFTRGELFKKKVVNLFHLPCPSVPPGLGIFVNNYKGKMNLTISYLNTLLDECDVLFLVDQLKNMPNE